MLLRFVRNRTSAIIVMYSLYLYFLGLSLRNTSKALELFHNQKRSMLLFGNGFNDLVHCRSIINIEEFLHLSQMKLLFKLVVNIFGSGFVLNQFTNLCLGSTSQKKEICLQQRILFDLLYSNMENIQFTQMVEHGILKHVTF